MKHEVPEHSCDFCSADGEENGEAQGALNMAFLDVKRRKVVSIVFDQLQR